MKKIIGFGDSFVWGLELQNNNDGSKGWIGQAAKNLGCEYNTTAYSGCSNDHIARQIYTWFASNTTENTLAVINWTWMSRWDFYLPDRNRWTTLGPTCIPKYLEHLVNETDAEDIVNFYHAHLNKSILWNKLRNLQTIYAAQSYLKQKNIINIQTYTDYDMFDITCEHQALTPGYINELQQLVHPHMQLFEGQNFVDWSKKKGFAVTTPYLHPLEDAHIAAAVLWQDQYAKALNI